MAAYDRTEYIEFLRQGRGREMVKVLTGVRGGGKTSLFARFMSELENEGVPEQRILYLDLSDPGMTRLFPAENLYRWILDRLSGDGRAYLFLDEAEALPDFERLADQLFRIRHFDLFLAGSSLNAAMPRLMKALSGRCLVREVYPLSFAETVSLREEPPPATELIRYIGESTFPDLSGREDFEPGLDRLISTALFHDVCADPFIRPGLLLKILRYLSPRLGSLIPLSDICYAAGRYKRPLLPGTLSAYLRILKSAGLLISAPEMRISNEGGLSEKSDARRFFFPDGAMVALWGQGSHSSYRLFRNAVAVELVRRFGAVGAARTSRGSAGLLTGRDGIPMLWQLIPDGAAPEAQKAWDAIRSAPDSVRKCVLTFTPEAFEETPGLFVRHLLPWFLHPHAAL